MSAINYESELKRAGANANRGWRRFLWLNYVTGFLVTMLLIAYLLLPGAPCAC